MIIFLVSVKSKISILPCVANIPKFRTRKKCGILAVGGLVLFEVLASFLFLPPYFFDTDPPLAALFVPPIAFVSVFLYSKITTGRWNPK